MFDSRTWIYYERHALGLTQHYCAAVLGVNPGKTCPDGNVGFTTHQSGRRSASSGFSVTFAVARAAKRADN